MNSQYDAKAQAALDELYTDAAKRMSAPSLTTQMKIFVLDHELGASNFYAAGGMLTDEIKLKCLELQYLEIKGLIKLQLA